MNAGHWEPVSVQELVQLVSSSLGLHEHQSPLLGVAPIFVEDADELVLLLVLGGSVECLHYVSAGTTNEANLTIEE